ncbi:MAG: hypothetical protein PHX08_05980 [Lachnospiraceae bacterium]|nr:hypothetical protein [Lachnospiraceae bacterium]
MPLDIIIEKELPNDALGSKLYILIESAEGKLRKVMTKTEALAFVEKIASIPPLHIENERLCEKEYKEVLYQGNQ